MGQINRQQWLTLGAAMAGWTLDALDFVLYLMAIPALQVQFGFGYKFAGLLASLTLVTTALGGIAFGYVSDRIGRTRTMMLTIVIFSVCSLGTAFAQSEIQLLIWRCLLGLGLGGEWAAGAALVSETWPPKHRGKAIGLMQSGWALGYILAAILAAVVLPRLGWRWLFAFGALPALLLFYIRRYVPESAIWLAERHTKTYENSLLLLFTRNFRAQTLLCVALLSAVMFGYWGLFTWLPNFLASPLEQGGAGLGLVKSVAWIVPMQLGALAGYISFGFLSDRFGRRLSLMLFLLAASVIVPIYGTMARSPLLLIFLGPILGFVGHGYFSAFGALLAEIFPTHIRAFATGFCYNTGKLVGAMAPFVIGAAATSVGIGLALALTSVFFLIGVLLASRLPETRGQMLESDQQEKLWEFWIDAGGTFTDCIARRPDGSLSTHKLLSSGTYRGKLLACSTRSNLRLEPNTHMVDGFFEGYTIRLSSTLGGDFKILKHDPLSGRLSLDREAHSIPKEGTDYKIFSDEPACITGIRYLMGLKRSSVIKAQQVRLGTTMGTNALLERKGARTAFITTAGFGDILEIAHQNRPSLFELSIKKPQPLYERVLEVEERIDVNGQVLTPLAIQPLASALVKLRADGIDSLAICLLNAHINSCHEEQIKYLARSLNLDFAHISLSSHVASVQRIVPRGNTTVVDAYLTPVLKKYLAQIEKLLPMTNIQVMSSAGGLISHAAFQGKDSILSGPAGGVVGVKHLAQASNSSRAIGFDMGGTSTDVCHFHGDVERRYEMDLKASDQTASMHVVAPMLAIETVAAGGGSICAFDGLRLTVGPQSAGADPGPACYGAGGPVTITDCNLVLGRLLPQHFPFFLDKEASLRGLTEIAQQTCQTSKPLSPQVLAAAFLSVAASNMARPIKQITLARGYDVRDYSLISFGGAAAQHACELASELGIKKIIQDRMASVLSAYGIGMADIRLNKTCDFRQILHAQALKNMGETFLKLQDELKEALAFEKITNEHTLRWQRCLDMRYVGQDSAITLNVDALSLQSCEAAFVKEHHRRFGFSYAKRSIEIRSLRLELVATSPRPKALSNDEYLHEALASSYIQARFNQNENNIPVYDSQNLKAGAQINGPALVIEPMTTIVIEEGWRATLRGGGYFEIVRLQEMAQVQLTKTRDPMNLAIFHNRMASIAEQMGHVLQKTALSVNVKERLDFSTALFSPEGDLVVNAPHIPVHLGAMGDSVRGVLRLMSPLKPECVYISNDPYMGGSHLPDITVISPVFTNDGSLLAIAANRAHHAEIGGISPGSMPPKATCLAEEGVLIRCFRYELDNSTSEAQLRCLLASGKYPSRSIDDNIADIYAQIAANETGRQELLAQAELIGMPVIHAYMQHLRDGASEAARGALRRFEARTYEFLDHMDDGTPIQVALRISHGPSSNLADPKSAHMVCDFSGTGGVHKGNLNANFAIVKSAAFYVMRCLLGSEVPLNEGLLSPLSFIIPTPSLLSPPNGLHAEELAAVNAGNVETSQRLVDVMLGALGVAAASQGTMNNVLFGSSASPLSSGFGYYETICGGAGATKNHIGASAVHTHMTNTRITDPEVLEERFPVKVKRFAIRRGSGGLGLYRGGDGVIRELEFLAKLSLSLITSRRTFRPYGLMGGEPGQAGINRLRRGHDGKSLMLEPMAQLDVSKGDILTIETPGGGGYGKAV